MGLAARANRLGNHARYRVARGEGFLTDKIDAAHVYDVPRNRNRLMNFRFDEHFVAGGARSPHGVVRM